MAAGASSWRAKRNPLEVLMAAAATASWGPSAQSLAAATARCVTCGAGDTVPCSFCTKAACALCQRQCAACQEIFCSMCSMENYTLRLSRTMCFICNEEEAKQLRRLRRADSEHGGGSASAARKVGDVAPAQPAPPPSTGPAAVQFAQASMSHRIAAPVLPPAASAAAAEMAAVPGGSGGAGPPLPLFAASAPRADPVAFPPMSLVSQLESPAGARAPSLSLALVRANSAPSQGAPRQRPAQADSRMDESE